MQQQIIRWALGVIIEFAREHGQELADQFADWLTTLISSEAAGIFGSTESIDEKKPAPLAGQEELCARLVDEYTALIEKGA